ncbi:hypothetical protein FH972_021017 [Carpinus fangiana]|uniref:Major facilitator superfamily (MFS) profile domain-containing protein n=1 Tax=Carpinus fangiana TaxID=176857 RepID=A0A5N6KQ78_9ROSI|nr:hypothetical protein FH972_021017 [Carpinus fangiana]
MATAPPSPSPKGGLQETLPGSSREASPAPSTRLDHNQAIEYRYFTYDTLIPDLINVPSDSSIKVPPPDYPDLSSFRDPLAWSKPRKMVLTWLSCVGTALSAMTAGMYAPPIEQMSEEWNISRVKAIIGITIFTAGFAIAPMVLAPFSELTGRRPVFVVAGTIFFILQICCASTRLFAGMLVSRFLVGCASSIFSTMVGGVVADIWSGEDRNTPMAMFTGAAMFGTGMGPMISGFIVQHTTWRWVFYSGAIGVAVLMVFIFFFFNETRGSVLLSRKASKLNAYYQAREAAGYFGLVDKTGEKRVRIRWKEQNAVFAAVTISGVIMTFVSIWQEGLAKRRGFSKPGPEQRLFFCCFESLAMPIGLFWFGWTAMSSIPWIVPAIAIGVATIGIFNIYLATFLYLADGYGPYASSAIAAQSFCRNMLGGAFPLFTQQMYVSLGIGGASSLLGGLGLVLTLVPWVLAWKGPKIRARTTPCARDQGLLISWECPKAYATNLTSLLFHEAASFRSLPRCYFEGHVIEVTTRLLPFHTIEQGPSRTADLPSLLSQGPNSFGTSDRSEGMGPNVWLDAGFSIEQEIHCCLHDEVWARCGKRSHKPRVVWQERLCDGLCKMAAIECRICHHATHRQLRFSSWPSVVCSFVTIHSPFLSITRISHPTYPANALAKKPMEDKRVLTASYYSATVYSLPSRAYRRSCGSRLTFLRRRRGRGYALVVSIILLLIFGSISTPSSFFSTSFIALPGWTTKNAPTNLTFLFGPEWGSHGPAWNKYQPENASRYIPIDNSSLGSGKEGWARLATDLTSNETVVIKQLRSLPSVERNFVPQTIRHALHLPSDIEAKWPTEIPSTLLLSSLSSSIAASGGTSLVPLLGYYHDISPFTDLSSDYPSWYLVTPYMSHGNLATFAQYIAKSQHNLSAVQLDCKYRPHLEALLRTISILQDHLICHDDVKATNIFVSNANSWHLGDFGQLRESSHPYHSSRIWISSLQHPDCRRNDVRRALKSYVSFLRDASSLSPAQQAAFDEELFAGRQPWARLYWTYIKDPTLASEAVQLSQTISPESELVEPGPRGLDPGWVPARLILGRQWTLTTAAEWELSCKMADPWDVWGWRRWMFAGWQKESVRREDTRQAAHQEVEDGERAQLPGAALAPDGPDLRQLGRDAERAGAGLQQPELVRGDGAVGGKEGPRRSGQASKKDACGRGLAREDEDGDSDGDVLHGNEGRLAVCGEGEGVADVVAEGDDVRGRLEQDGEEGEAGGGAGAQQLEQLGNLDDGRGGDDGDAEGLGDGEREAGLVAGAHVEVEDERAVALGAEQRQCKVCERRRQVRGDCAQGGGDFGKGDANPGRRDWPPGHVIYTVHTGRLASSFKRMAL